MLAVTFLTLLGLGLTLGDQISLLSQEEKLRYFGTVDDAEVPDYAIVYVEHVNSKSGAFAHVTGEAIADPSPEFQFHYKNEEVHITLKQDDSFLAPDMKAARVLTDDGEYWEPIRRDCLYRGYVTKHGAKKSSAQISTCSGMMGTIYRDDERLLYIEPMDDEDASARDIGQGLAHIAYEHHRVASDNFCKALEIKESGAASYSGAPANDDAFHGKDTRAAKRLEIYVVADKALYDRRGSRTTTCINALMNSVTHGLGWLNSDLTVVMKGFTVISGSNNQGLVPTEDGKVYLSRLVTWASGQSGSSTWDLVAVISGCDLYSVEDSKTSDGLLGIAYVGTTCGYFKGSVSEMRNWHVVGTVVHEIGHNLGCRHDSSGNSCSASGYIMAAYATSCDECEPDSWSSCSKSYYSNSVGSFTCL